ncbi:MAG TPA: methyltransferase domain-containing protein [Hyphomicrobiaceae bacterium]|nr:methyltransferase domain-containing protein [Hyphomicrobiaceae bacterium]
MSIDQGIISHYTKGRVLERTLEALRTLGKDPTHPTIDDLAPLDEFHIGGREATEHFVPLLGFRAGQRLIDVGCGVGGPARYVARSTLCHVTGIDLTPEHIEVATELSRLTGLAERTRFEVASGTALPFADGAFDGAMMLHVGMNIADKAALTREARRVLKPGASFGIYDIMRTGAGDITYPCPWSGKPETSFPETPETYKRHLEAAGFTIRHEASQREFALDVGRRGREEAAKGSPMPAILRTLRGDDFSTRIGNLGAEIAAGRLAPYEIIAVAA